MNFCELELAKTVQDSEDIEAVARDLHRVNPSKSVDDIKSYLSNLIDTLKSQGGVFSPLGFQEFFRVDGKINNLVYIKVREIVLQKITDEIFGDSPALSDAQLAINLNSLRRHAVNSLGNNALKLHYKYSYQKDNIVISEQNAGEIANYLIAYHLPTVVQSVCKGLVKYENNNFVFDIKTKVRTDWNSDKHEDKPAELSSAVKMMLDITPMLDISGNKVGNFHLTTNSFFYAISELFENLESQFVAAINDETVIITPWYQKIVENPLELINYFLSEDFENYLEKDQTLSGNILRSVLYRWIKHNGKISKFAEKCLYATNSAHYNPLHLLITAAVKHCANTFLDREYTPRFNKIQEVKGKNKTTRYELASVSQDIVTLDRHRSIVAEAGGRISEAISKESLSGILPQNIEDLTVEHVRKVLKLLFPYQPISIPDNDSRLPQWKENFKIFYEYLKSSSSSFSKLLETKVEGATDSFASQYYWIIRNALNTNPYLIKGTQANNIDSQVPVYGLRTVATSIPLCIANLRNAVNKKNSIYRNINVSHTSPYEHSALYQGNLPIPRVVYNSSFKYLSGNDSPTKEYRDLSAKEMAHLSIGYDYLNAGNLIRIQPITVSDKPRVPFFEFDKNSIQLSESQMLAEVELLYKQSILNTINEYSLVLGIQFIGTTNAKNIVWKELETALKDVNDYLKNNGITKKILWDKMQEYNNLNRTNITFAEHLDFSSIKGSDVISVSNSSVLYTNAMISGNFWKNQFKNFLENLKSVCPEINLSASKTLENEVDELLDQLEKGDTSYEMSSLYKYFVLHNYLAENVLAVTVGLPMAHKGKGEKWEDYDSKANLTMVKRMVALTSTMHPCTKGVLTGLPSEINTQTVELGEVEMYTYSGSTASGSGFTDKLTVSDGIIYGTRAGDNLLKASIGDVRPKGNMLKLLHHDFDPVKGYSRLVKCAEQCIDNAMIRTWDLNDDDATILNAFSPKNFMKLSFQNAKLNINSFAETEAGELLLVDYNDCELTPAIHRKFNDSVYRLNAILYNEEENSLELEYYDPVSDSIEIVKCSTDLYSLWEAFGGAFSCDADGNYNESSQDAITTLLNRVGFKKENASSVQSQADVDQYLKSQVVYYIHTTSAQKSLQAPSSTLQEALAGKGYTVKMGIDRLGIQLDADHSAEDSHIREISQLMSNLAEGGYVTEKAEKVYNRIFSLIQTSLSTMGIDTIKLSKLSEQDRLAVHETLGKRFSQMFKRIMADPNADVMGLANALAVELQHKDVLIPISDRQHLSKYHTTVGSYFNKFIARAWTGRGDVLMPGHNMLMVYEDLTGNVYMPGDSVISGDMRTPIREHIREQMFESETVLKESFIANNRITAHNLHPNRNYYVVDEITRNFTLVQTNTYKELIDLSNRIAAGAVVVRAYNLPRNLNAKQVGVIVETATEQGFVSEYHDIYFFKTHKKLASCGILLTELSKLKEEDVSETFKLAFFGLTGKQYSDKATALGQLLATKKHFGAKFQDILGHLSAKNFSDIANELDLDETNIVNVSIHTELDERITSNNYSHVWGKAQFSEIAQLKEKYFENRLRTILSAPAEHSNILTKEGEKIAVELFNMSSKCTFCVPEYKYIQDGALEIPVVVDDENYRLDDNGYRMYKWPYNAKLFHKNGYDIILLPSEEKSSFENKLEILAESSYFSGYRTENSYKLSIPYYGTFNKNSREYDSFIEGLAMAQYQSWLKTNHAVQARIPSQSLSFAMHLKTVGYCPWDTNISICSNAHVFTQGSDFDIDKIYAMMYAVSGSGIIKQSEEYTFTINENMDDNLSVEDQLINNLVGVHLGKLLNTKTESGITGAIFVNDSEEIATLYRELSKQLLGVGKLSGTTITLSAWHVLEKAFEIANISQESLTEIGPVALNWLNTVVENLNTRAQVLQDQKSDKYGGLQNNTLDQMLDIFDDVRILMAGTAPTTMYPINSVVERRGLEGAHRNHLDPSSVWFVNQTAMVGKDGVGITASAQKAMLALTQYNSVRKNENFAHPTVLELPKSWQTYYHDGNYVNTEFFINFVLPGQKLNSESLIAIVEWASKWKTADGKSCCEVEINSENEFGVESITIKGAQFGENGIVISKGMAIDTELATTINSAFISSATDNAKEMKLDLIGGHPLLLPAFMYGLTLGMPVDLLVVIFTDPDVKNWILKARGNIFVGGGGNSKIRNKLSEFVTKTAEQKAKKHVLDILLKGGEALTGLSRILSINQGMKVNVGEVQNWYLQLANIMETIIPANITAPSDGLKRFDAYEFFTLPTIEMRRHYSKVREDSDLAFNTLDVLSTVPHYYAMCQVPLVFKEVMENQSTDIRLLHKIMSDDNYGNRYIDPKNIPNYMRSINHLKIFEFLKQLDWKYKTDTVYVGSRSEEINEEGVQLSTSEARGIYSLKKFIEEQVIKPMQEKYPTNAFLANIQKVTRLLPIVSRTSIKALGISFNMTNPQNADMASIVKLGFYEIQDEGADSKWGGHTFGEWMFLYDLLVNHHDVGSNSFTNVFDQMINWDDDNNIITQYYKFVLKHDSPVASAYSMETKELIPKKLKMDDEDPVGIRMYCQGEILPLRINTEARFAANSYISRSALQRYYNNGNLFIFTC